MSRGVMLVHVAKRTVVLCAIVLAAMSGIPAGSPHAAELLPALSTESGYLVGDTATISGTGFPAGSQVNLVVTDPAGQVEKISTVSGADGTFRFPLVLYSEGQSRVDAVDAAGAVIAYTYVTAAPRLAQ